MPERKEYRVVGTHPLYKHECVPLPFTESYDEAYEARRAYRKVYDNVRIQTNETTGWVDLPESKQGGEGS